MQKLSPQNYIRSLSRSQWIIEKLYLPKNFLRLSRQTRQVEHYYIKLLKKPDFQESLLILFLANTPKYCLAAQFHNILAMFFNCHTMRALKPLVHISGKID